MKKHKLGFKWFGSLRNLVQNQPAEKENPKTAAKHDGSLGEDMLGKKCVDDMDARPLNSSRALSCDTCSHLVTMPRHSLKERRSRKGKITGKAAGAMQQKGDYVADSPLLSVLLHQGVPALGGASLLGTAVKPHTKDTSPPQTEMRQSSAVLEDETTVTSPHRPLSPEAQEELLMAEPREDHGQLETMMTSPTGISTTLPEQYEDILEESLVPESLHR